MEIQDKMETKPIQDKMVEETNLLVARGEKREKNKKTGQDGINKAGEQEIR